jgi:uncharacterized OB-fold protein
MDAPIVEGTSPRMAPDLSPAVRPFWTGGERGNLLLPRCEACDRWAEPGVEACPGCGGATAYQPVSGRGTVFTFTVNGQPWNPDVPVPYVIALIELDEQEGLRIPTNIVNCDPDDVRVGLPVRVLFEHQGEAYVPLFEPAG